MGGMISVWFVLDKAWIDHLTIRRKDLGDAVGSVGHLRTHVTGLVVVIFQQGSHIETDLGLVAILFLLICSEWRWSKVRLGPTHHPACQTALGKGERECRSTGSSVDRPYCTGRVLRNRLQAFAGHNHLLDRHLQ